MEPITLANLSSLKNPNEAATDRFATHRTNEPFFMAISIVAPILGGDTNGDGQLTPMEATKGIGDFISGAVTDLSQGINNFEDGFTNSPQTPAGMPQGIGPTSSSLNVSTQSAGEIAFPMPLELTYADSQNWADDNSALSDLAMAAGAQVLSMIGGGARRSIVGSLLDAFSAQTALSAVKKVGQKNYGIAIEPRKEMFYSGPAFRDFSFSWDLSAKNAQEAEQIKKAIAMIRKNQAPDRISDAADAIGFSVWKLPSTFLISFRRGNAENTFLPKIKPCVVTAVNTNMMKNGSWRSFGDGAPIGINLSISFREIEPVTQKDIDEGY